MFNIDLLKGQGIPAKSRPEGVAALAVTIAIPLVIAVTMFTCYLNNAVVISINERGVTSYQAKTEQLSKALRTHGGLENKQKLYENCLSDIGSIIAERAQWSPVLVTVVKNLPDTVFLTKLEVTQEYIKKTVPKQDEPKETIDVSVPVRTLKIKMAGAPETAFGQAVKTFRSGLAGSNDLKKRIEDITVSRNQESLGEKVITIYDIECTFKPQL